MKRWCLASLVLVLLCRCGKSKHMTAVDENIANMEELNRILDDVSNEESAKAAVTKIEALGPRGKATLERANTLDNPSPDEQVRISAKLLEFTEKNKERMRVNASKVGMYPVLRDARIRALGRPGGAPR
jgi:hypothetical protein